MGHQVAPTRNDATARQFLAAAAELIDAYLHPGPSPRSGHSQKLGHVRFPDALEWLRTEDVIQLTTGLGRSATSRREFFSRWPTREDFLPDALVYALLRDYEADDPREYVQQIPSIPMTVTPVSALIVSIADGLLSALVRHPRSYLMLHLGPLLPKHPELRSALRPGTRAAAWVGVYDQLVNGLDLVMRPEWTLERTASVLQAMLDGFVLHHRIYADAPASRWEGAGMFADAIIAFLIGAVDWDLTGQPGRMVLDRLLRP